MKYKTEDLEGVLLAAAVAKAEGWDYMNPPPELEGFAPHRSWLVAGPIIDREGIDLMRLTIEAPHEWSANFEILWMTQDQEDPHTGPTPLIAAMRAYVASKLGKEVELP